MSHGILGEFRIGEDISLALDATAGDVGQVTAIGVAMKPALVADNRLVLDDEAQAVALATAPQTAPGIGWTIALSGAQSAQLVPGLYGIDARLSVGSGVIITDQTAFISLTRAALA